MKRTAGVVFVVAGLCLAAPSPVPVHAGPLTDLMVDPEFGSSFDAVDRTLAAALDAALADVQQACQGSGAPCPEGLTSLANSINRLYGQVGQLPNSGNPQADLAAIAGALRGAGPEELSALRLLSNEFASDQRDQVRSRLNARRLGATGLAVNLDAPGPDFTVTSRRSAGTLIGAAGADDVPEDFSRWGGYLNVQLADGQRDATVLEDGFDLSGLNISIGADYLLGAGAVLGAMLDYSDRKAVFAGGADNQGRISSNGLALVLYGSKEWDGLYLSGSAGYQRQNNHIRRFLHFTLPLPVLDAVNTGSTDSGALTLTLDAGRMFQKGAFGFEPMGRLLYRHTRFDAFVEESIDLATLGPSGFALAFDKTSAETLNGSLGLRGNYTLTPAFGVVVPYAQYEFRREFSRHAMKTQADFADILAAGVGSPTSGFELKSDRPDSSYHVVEAGASLVFKHGVQAFVNARSVLGLHRADLLVVAAGLRAEF